MSMPSVDDRLAEVLQLFLLPDYNVASPTYHDLLLTHISDKNNGFNLLDYLHIEKYRAWVLKAVDVWSGGIKPKQPVIVFTLRLLGLIGKEEQYFLRLTQDDVLGKVCKVLDVHRDELPASIKMAFNTMLSDFIGHKIGRAWVKMTGVWKDIIKYAHYNHTLYVTRESQRFLSSLLIGESENREFCTEVILWICEPLMKTELNGQMQASLEDLYTHQNKQLCNTLNLITNIFETTLFVSLDNTIPDLFEDLTNLQIRIKALITACISTPFFRYLHKLWILLGILKMKHGLTKNSTHLDMEGWENFREVLCFIQGLLLSKRAIIDVSNTHKMSMMYWMKIQSIHKFALPPSLEHKFENQVICLMITPLCVCIRSSYMKDHAFFEMFVDKLFDVTSHRVQRMVYNTKTVMTGTDDLPLEKICKATIDMVMELKDVMDRELAVIAFQMMCHVLKNYTNDKCPYSPESEPSMPTDQQIRPTRKSILDGDPIIEVPNLLSTLLTSITLLAEKFKFKWKECVETTCVLVLAEGILKHPGVQPHICVQALKLCKLAIQDFMPPNLALLIESDSDMISIGPTLYKRLHDPNWEVRDSVFETLNTIAAISEDKYPAFQDFLLANNFLQVAIDIAMTDGESYVRASALVFIATTIRINKLWEGVLSQLELPSKAMNMIRNESEAVVRREAVMIIKDLYRYRRWTKPAIDAMNRIMVEAAVLDLHWEVKVNALEFWRHFIHSHLTDQGMLDGSFPNMTFSKENRKIVALNESEIKRRLHKCLDELARQNCLGVLLATLEDSSDLAVSKTSADIITKLKVILVKYKVHEPQAPIPSAKDSAIIDSAYVKDISNNSKPAQDVTNRENSTNVIDEIADANDSNLLSSLYQNSLKMNSESEIAKPEKLQYISGVTKDIFLRTILAKDIEAYIEERERWLQNYTNSIESILEDIVTAHQSKDINSMDCY